VRIAKFFPGGRDAFLKLVVTRKGTGVAVWAAGKGPWVARASDFFLSQCKTIFIPLND